MTPEEFSSALAKIADQTVTSNFESIKEHLLDGVLSTDTRDELIGKMLANAIRLSVNLSVSATMSALIQMEIVDLSEYRSGQTAPQLTLLRFDRPSPDSPEKSE